MDWGKLFSEIGANADKLGALGLLVVMNVAFLYALAKDKFVTGNRYRERKEEDAAEIAELKAALKTALLELDKNKEAYLRLQIEKDLLWQERTSRTRSRAKGTQ